MHIFLDHLSSIIIGTVVILCLAAAQYGTTHAGMEQVASHGVKAKTLVFGKWVERDILAIGANFGRNTYRFEEPTRDELGNAKLWVFYSDSIRVNGDTLRMMTRYRLLETREVDLADGRHQLYELRRDTLVVPIVSGRPAPFQESAWVSDIWSIGTLSFFQIELLDRKGVEPKEPDGDTDIAKVDYIRVRFGVVPEYLLKPDNYIRELYWNRTLKVRPFWQPPS